MACDHGPCKVLEYELDLPATPAGGQPPAKTAAIGVGSVKKSSRPAGTPVDSTGMATPEDAILAKLDKDFQNANKAQC